MVRGLGIEPELIFTGRCARNQALARALEERLGMRLLIPAEPEFTGALGAALLAAEYVAQGALPDRAKRFDIRPQAAPVSDYRADALALFRARRQLREDAFEGSFVLDARAAAGARAGIDAGALFTKAVVVDGDRVSFAVLRSTSDYAAVAQTALDRALGTAGLDAAELARVTATGLGAGRLPYAFKLDDMSALAAGTHALFPEAEQVIDIGGHGTRVVRLNAGGGIKDFTATGQCAAGGARILETIAHLLHLQPSDLGELALRSTAPAQYSAGCPVFAETEAISLMMHGTSAVDLLAGLHRSIAAKTLALARANLRAGVRAVAGGGAKDAGLVACIRANCPSLLVPPEPMIISALGAALADCKSWNRNAARTETAAARFASEAVSEPKDLS